MNLNLSSKTVVLAAYGVYPIAVTGSVFVCKSADTTFKLSVDGGEEFDMDSGWYFDLNKQSFSRLIMRNVTAAAVTVSFYTGSSQMGYYPPVQVVTQITKDAPTYAKGSGVKNLNAAATDNYNGLDGTKVRRQFTVFNSDANLDIYVMAGANVMAVVPPRQSWTHLISGALGVNNPNGAAIQYVVGETFYA
jgi:hypothetical protein